MQCSATECAPGRGVPARQKIRPSSCGKDVAHCGDRRRSFEWKNPRTLRSLRKNRRPVLTYPASCAAAVTTFRIQPGARSRFAALDRRLSCKTLICTVGRIGSLSSQQTPSPPCAVASFSLLPSLSPAARSSTSPRATPKRGATKRPGAPPNNPPMLPPRRGDWSSKACETSKPKRSLAPKPAAAGREINASALSSKSQSRPPRPPHSHRRPQKPKFAHHRVSVST